MTGLITFMADAMVAILLVMTITTCVALGKRITKLKSDETTMRKTIGDLIVATESAERAIASLRTALGDCDRTLADRLRTAERYSADLAAQVEAGEDMLGRMSQIVDSSRTLSATREIAPDVSSSAAPVEPQQPIQLAPVAEIKVGKPVNERMLKTSSMAQNLVDRALRRLEGQNAA